MSGEMIMVSPKWRKNIEKMTAKMVKKLEGTFNV